MLYLPDNVFNLIISKGVGVESSVLSDNFLNHFKSDLWLLQLCSIHSSSFKAVVETLMLFFVKQQFVVGHSFINCSEHLDDEEELEIRHDLMEPNFFLALRHF